MIIFKNKLFICLFFSNGGGTQTFHLRASSEVERQKWVTALELAKAKVFNCVCVHVKGTVEWPFEADKVFFPPREQVLVAVLP